MQQQQQHEHEREHATHATHALELVRPQRKPSVEAVMPKGKISPKIEQAIRLYACGKGSQIDVAKACGVSVARLQTLLQSDEGIAIQRGIRNELEHKFQALFEKTINVLESALDHPDPSIALAGANLWLKSAKSTKVEVQLTAEDIVQKLMRGESIDA